MLKITVPATSANLGAGLDCIGLALSLHNEVTGELTDGGEPRIWVEDERAGSVPKDGNNLVWRAFARVYAAVGKEAPGLEIGQRNRIPIARGLGSSATAIVAGLILANEFLGGRFSKEALLGIGLELEGHVDNLAAAMMGGVTVACLNEGEVHCERYEAAEGLKAVICVPDLQVDTAESRRRLQQRVLLRNAVYNMGHALIFIGGVTTGAADKIRIGMEDRLHQGRRVKMIPGAKEVMEGAVEAGAIGACLSGSGPTILALANERFDEIERAMEEAFRRAGVQAEATAMAIEKEGAVAERIEDPEGEAATRR